jgi:hypothetical protein
VSIRNDALVFFPKLSISICQHNLGKQNLLTCDKVKVFSLYVKFLLIFARNQFFQMLAKITPSVQLLRPKHWIKNVLLFTPLIFSGSLLKYEAILYSAVGFIYFSIAASLVYTINDLADVERDRLHPVKRMKRPLASGAVSKQTAVGIIVLFSLLSLTSVFFSLAFAWVLLGYCVKCSLQCLSQTSTSIRCLFCGNGLCASCVCGRSRN